MRESGEKNYERQYFKAHFGPEESEERAQISAEEESQKKRLMAEVLRHQMSANKEYSETSKQEELMKDLQFLNAAANTQYIENLALRRKEHALKQNLKETWQSQINIKKQHKESDNYFV